MLQLELGVLDINRIISASMEMDMYPFPRNDLIFAHEESCMSLGPRLVASYTYVISHENNVINKQRFRIKVRRHLQPAWATVRIQCLHGASFCSFSFMA